MKALIFAAGIGSRLKEETLYKPKALVEIGGKPLLQHVIEKLESEGISEFVVNVHHFPDMIADFVGKLDSEANIFISDERLELLDTGGGLKKAASFFKDSNDPVLMYNVDILSNINLPKLIQTHHTSGALATLAVRKRKTQRYLKFNRQHRLVGWVNKKSGEKRVAVSESFENAVEMAFSGIHIVNQEIFNLMPAENKFSMIDLYLMLAKDYFIYGYYDDSTSWIDVGKPDSLAEARRFFL
ncbi:MAG TPA: sugar phosphate nucleotidyltransferase [Mariniphaga sp.]|nr:sugar phosphate nucleotidyltransferase [Mariniphaga sp.]